MSAWALFAVVGVATFCLRASFLLFAGERSMGAFERALRYVPAAVLPAVAVVAFRGPTLPPAALVARLLAAAVGGLIAWRTRSPGWTIAGGMVALWLASAALV